MSNDFSATMPWSMLDRGYVCDDREGGFEVEGDAKGEEKGSYAGTGFLGNLCVDFQQFCEQSIEDSVDGGYESWRWCKLALILVSGHSSPAAAIELIFSGGDTGTLVQGAYGSPGVASGDDHDEGAPESVRSYAELVGSARFERVV